MKHPRETPEKRLRLSQFTIQRAPDAVFYINSQGQIQRVNQAACKYFGYSETELTSKTILDLIPNYGEKEWQEFWKKLKKYKELSLKTWHQAKSGELIPVEIITNYLKFEGEEYACNFTRDISERKKTDDTLHQYNKRLKTLHDIDRGILAAHSVDEIAQAAMGHIQELVSCLRASVAVFDFKSGKNTIIATKTKGKTKIGAGVTLPMNAFGDIEQLRKGTANIVHDIKNVSDIPGVLSVRTEGVRSYINVPLIAKGALFGVLNLGAENPHFFTDEHIEITQQVADSLAVAIKQARLNEQIERHATELEQRVAKRTAELSKANETLKTEITGRKKIEAALRESEVRYRTLYNNTPVMMHSIDADAKIISVNDYWLETLQYERDEVIGRSSFDFMTEKSAQYAVETAIPKLLKRGSVKNIEYQLIKKNGEVIDVQLSAMAQLDEKVNLIQSLAFLVDVTERKKAEKALRAREEALHESEARKGAIVETALDCIISMDHEGKIIEFNPAAEKTFGYVRAKVIGKNLVETIIPPSLRKAHLRGLEHYHATGEGPVLGKRIEIAGMHSDGSEFPVELAIVSIHLGDNPIFTAHLRDITQRKRAENALKAAKDAAEAADREKSELLAELKKRHDELKNTLQKLKGMQNQLEAENNRKTRELEEARRLQLAMLPKTTPELPNIDIAVYMQTATEVGGDYYDFSLDSDDTLTVAIGDGTGHGLQAGTIVASTKSLFKALADEPDPRQILKKMSIALKSMGFSKMFMAMTVAKFDNYRLTLSAAGMPFTRVNRAETGNTEEIELKGVPLGSFPDFKYQQKVLRLNPHDTVLFVSDGIHEAFNSRKEMLGEERVTKLFTEIAHEQPDQIVQQLLDLATLWANGQAQMDDITILVMKMK